MLWRQIRNLHFACCTYLRIALWTSWPITFLQSMYVSVMITPICCIGSFHPRTKLYVIRPRGHHHHQFPYPVPAVCLNTTERSWTNDLFAWQKRKSFIECTQSQYKKTLDFLHGYNLISINSPCPEKRGDVIFDYKSRISWWIFIIFILLETGTNTPQSYVIYLLDGLMTS